MSKPNKSIRKRIRITKTGKLLRRKAGQDHFNAKESRRVQRRKSVGIRLSKTMLRQVQSANIS